MRKFKILLNKNMRMWNNKFCNEVKNKLKITWLNTMSIGVSVNEHFPEIEFSIFGIRLFREKQKTNKQTKYTTCTVCKGYRLQTCISVKISDTTCRSSMPREDFRIEHWTLLSDIRELWTLGCNWPPPH